MLSVRKLRHGAAPFLLRRVSLHRGSNVRKVRSFGENSKSSSRRKGKVVLKLTKFLVVVLLCAGAMVNAEQVSLKNGDHLTGTIVSMDGKKLVLKTAYAGDVSIDWDVGGSVHLRPTPGRNQTNQQTVTGTVKSEDGNYVVTTPQGAQTVAKSDVAVMRSPADQAAYEKSLHPGMMEGWTGGGNFGLALARGNSDTTNVALGFDATRKTTKDSWVIDAASIYTTDGATHTTSANSFQGAIRYDRNLSKRSVRLRCVRRRLRRTAGPQLSPDAGRRPGFPCHRDSEDDARSALRSGIHA